MLRMTMMKHIIAILAGICLIPSAGVTGVIDVPMEHPTIQGGVDAAAEDDTILVAPGTYRGQGNRDIDFSGKAVALLAREGSESTVIDCEGTAWDPHRGFYFHSGEGHESMVAGFTVLNGYACEGSELGGGGICCDNSSPMIDGCILRANHSTGSGGGIYLRESSARISGCTIRDNSSEEEGAGIYFDTASITLTECTISDNVTHMSGGGIYFHNSSGTITRCAVHDNNAFDSGGGVFCSDSSPEMRDCALSDNVSYFSGGGIYCLYSSPWIDRCRITGNVTLESGGGIYCLYSSPVIDNSRIIENASWGSGGGIFLYRSDSNVNACVVSGNNTAINGGGVYIFDLSPSLTNCFIIANGAGAYGGGIFCAYSEPLVTACTLSENTAGEEWGGPGLCSDQSSPVVTNSIIWGNGWPEIRVIGAGRVLVTFSDVRGLPIGEGNISADPCFAGESDYHLAVNSPCIDSGTDCGILTDFDGQERPGGNGYDIGADEWYPSLIKKPWKK